MGIIKGQYLIIRNALIAHHGSTYLAESDTMSPPFSMQDEAIGSLLHLEG